MTIRPLYPTIVPSLDLNFAATKRLDPRVTFSRATTGTFVDSDGLIKTAARGVARFSHSPLTGECLGILAEESRVNRAWPSQNIVLNTGGGQSWSGDGTAAFTNNAALAPDGTSTAIKIYKRSGTPGDYIHLRAGGGSFGVFQSGESVSCFFKAAELSVITIMFTTVGGYTLNLSTGTVGIGSLVAFPNGWYRWSHSFTSTPGDIRFYPGGDGYSGDGTSGVFLWGAQGENGSVASSYIPTTVGQVTRSAEILEIAGNNFSSWYNNTEGTFVTDMALGFTQNAGNPFTFGGVLYTTVDNSVRTLANTPNILQGGLPNSQTVFSKTAVGLQSGNYAMAVNGSLVNSSSIVYTPAGALWQINSSLGSLGTIRRVAYYPVRLQNAILQNVTR